MWDARIQVTLQPGALDAVIPISSKWSIFHFVDPKKIDFLTVLSISQMAFGKIEKLRKKLFVEIKSTRGFENKPRVFLKWS